MKSKPSSQSMSTPKSTQGTLFSFFSKKPPKTSSPSHQTQDDSPSTQSKTSSQNISTHSNPDNSKNSPIITSSIHTKYPYSQIKVSTRLAVYWPDDEAYYNATVTACKKSNKDNEQSFFVTLIYDDDEVETIDLVKEKFNILETTTKSNNANGDFNDTKKRAKNGLTKDISPPPSLKKRRVIEESEDEGEEEFQDDDEEMSEGSEFLVDSSEDESMSDAQSDSVITDDDNEVVPMTKRVKTVRVSSGEGGKNHLHLTSYEKKNIKSSASLSPVAQDSKPRTQSTTFSSLITPPPKAGTSSKTSDSFSEFSRESGKNESTSQDGNSGKTKKLCTITPPREISPKQLKSDERVVIPKPQSGVVNAAGTHYHNHFKFLQLSHRRDINKRSADHPQYDHRTLFVDYNEIEKVTQSKLTPAQKQWWELKAQYADSLLLFKTGKFYEIFHMDADVAVQILGHVYMKGPNAHAGFPESAYGKFCSELVKAGYKVARVEQTETPDMLKERKKITKGAKPQVVNREVCSIVTTGTRTFCYLDDTYCLKDGNIDEGIGPLLAIKEIIIPQTTDEKNNEDEIRPVCEYGVAIVDSIRGVVTLGQFADDVLRSRMDTLMKTYRPMEILVEGGIDGASPTLLSLLKASQNTELPSSHVETIKTEEYSPKSTAVDPQVRKKIERPNDHINPWDVEETISEIIRKRYYPRSSKNDSQVDMQCKISRWPEVLKSCILGGANLALSAFGACLFYLQRNLIDEEILSMGIIKAYCPPEFSECRNSSSGLKESYDVQLKCLAMEEQRLLDGVIEKITDGLDYSRDLHSEAKIDHLSLDGTSIANLEILANSHSNTVAGSLWSKVNFTKTPHGSRLLRAWLLRPLFQKTDIDRRADAVQEMTSGSAAIAMSEARSLLSKCGDIERLLSRVHSMGGNPEQSGYHPNERAILYETAIYTKRKVEDFNKLMNGLRSAAKIPEVFSHIDIQSGLFSKIVRTTENGGYFPSNLNEELDWFFDNFDCKKASNGLFEPGRGIDTHYDSACDEYDNVKLQLENYRDEICSELRVPKSVCIYGNTKDDSKDKFLLEIPAQYPVPSNFIIKAKRGNGNKQINKYTTEIIDELVERLEYLIDQIKAGKERGMQMVFAKFDSMRSLWASAAQATALLDALGALAQLSSRAGYSRPIIVDCPSNECPMIRVKQGVHPCVDQTFSGSEFIPNDIWLGGKEGQKEKPRVLLLSGPNMGGKSTLLRQTCLIAILAQIGCFVPAEEVTLTPFDRIFTRLGASDRILLGQSTFFVELAETAVALRGATRRSLVIMDELGRGTSTFDGTAIASATVKHLVERNQCLTLFATHYHSLLEDWKHQPTVALGHMECLVEEVFADEKHEDNEYVDNEISEKNITFLYTLGEGSCPKSFGINVAHLAGIPSEVVMKAKKVSADFESTLHSGGSSISVKVNSTKEILIMKSKIERAASDEDWEELERLWNTLQE